MVDLDHEVVDLGRQGQVSFETKEELLRLAHVILLKNQLPRQSVVQNPAVLLQAQPAGASIPEVSLSCAACR